MTETHKQITSNARR